LCFILRDVINDFHAMLFNQSTEGYPVLDLIWLIFLMVLLHHFWRQRHALVRASYWLKAKGRITHCEWVSTGRSIWPKIEYTYEVNETKLTGEHLFLDTTHNSPNSKYARKMAYQAAMAFKEERPIDVYYNPNEPHQSALDITIPKKLNFIIVLLSFIILTHIGIMIYHYLH
jgi:hypothetical protein